MEGLAGDMISTQNQAGPADLADLNTKCSRRVARCRDNKSHTPAPKTPRMTTTTSFSTAEHRWSAVVSRNPDATHSFVYAVKTTRIYCRPDCKARLARRANVFFYNSGLLAEEAGYRACKRCKPELQAAREEDPLVAKIRHAVSLVEESALRGHKIALTELATQVGLSKWHLQRVFTKLKGLSPYQMSNSILNTIEAEADGMPTPVAELDYYVPDAPFHPFADDFPLTPVSLDAQEFEAFDWAQAESEQAGVDDVLRDLFPELYIETPAWTPS